MLSILITRRGDDWKASIEGHPGIWGRGCTEGQAVLDCLITALSQGVGRDTISLRRVRPFDRDVCPHKQLDGSHTWVDRADSQCELCGARD